MMKNVVTCISCVAALNVSVANGGNDPMGTIGMSKYPPCRNVGSVVDVPPTEEATSSTNPAAEMNATSITTNGDSSPQFRDAPLDDHQANAQIAGKIGGQSEQTRGGVETLRLMSLVSGIGEPDIFNLNRGNSRLSSIPLISVESRMTDLISAIRGN